MTELLEQDVPVLRALRARPGRTLGSLARDLGLPTTNFGRPPVTVLRRSVDRLVADGLVEERGSRYRLSERGRRALAARALDL
jgi:DNA-binding MarR family transcriptional regulator